MLSSNHHKHSVIFVKKKTVDSEKFIFATVLITMGIFVISLFLFTLVQFNMSGQAKLPLRTQLIEDGPVETRPAASMDDSAQMLIVIGALAFSLLGGVIFLGLKAHDKYL